MTYIGVAKFPLAGSLQARNCASNIEKCWFSWYHWDTLAYVDIAQHGYANVQYTAFFPLWPLLEHIVGRLFGTSFVAYYEAGLLLSNACFYFALVLLYVLLNEEFEATVARTVLFFLAFYPYSIFFFAGYTESLFLLLCVAVFLCLRREESWYWWLAGFFGLLATLTRSTGMVLAVPFFVVAAQRFWHMRGDAQTNWLQKIHMFLPIMLIPVGLLLYMLYLAYTKGDPFIFSIQEDLVWKRHLSLPGVGIVQASAALVTLVNRPDWLAQNLLDILFTLFPIGVLIVGWKRLPLRYSLFAASIILLSLSYPVNPPGSLTSAPRYMLGAFPFIIVLALWAKRQSFDRAFVACSLPLFALNVVLFTSHAWVG
jgi:Gpi18-like mannosyltransferase